MRRLGVAELWAEFSQGASLELSWAIHLPTQTGRLVITHAQWLFPAASSSHCSASDMNSSLQAPHIQPREFLQFSSWVEPAASQPDSCPLAGLANIYEVQSYTRHNAESSTCILPFNAPIKPAR